jgi:hypothetical protein
MRGRYVPSEPGSIARPTRISCCRRHRWSALRVCRKLAALALAHGAARRTSSAPGSHVRRESARGSAESGGRDGGGPKAAVPRLQQPCLQCNQVFATEQSDRSGGASRVESPSRPESRSRNWNPARDRGQPGGSPIHVHGRCAGARAGRTIVRHDQAGPT